MNYRMVLYIIGQMMKVEGLLMFMPLIIAIMYNESVLPFVIPIALLLGVGLSLTVRPPKNKVLRSKDGFACVGLCWVVLALFGALPFVISGSTATFTDALFESVSGFTTTGASVIADVEVLDKGILFWRSLTHWVGGMGVLVFVLAVLPRSDAKSGRLMHLMRAEVPGPTVGKIAPKISRTARVMYAIYVVLTIIEVVFLLFGGMSFFDALIHSFGTAGTGGFSIKNASIGAYNSAYIEYVIGAFMLLFGINFNLFYLILIGHFLRAIKSEELWSYFIIITVAVTTITFNIMPLYQGGEESFRMAFFQVASIISTTGYSTTDFGSWPMLSQAILVILMFFGGCAGSTAGGMKIGRVILLVKNAAREIRYILHPRTVVSVKIDGKAVDNETIRGSTSYLIVYLCIFVLSIIGIIALNGCDLVTGFTSVASCLNNIGPGLAEVGPMSNFGNLSGLSKWILSFNMLAGRLELFPILMLFSRSTWKK
ncbi:MAG: TrkH family potassium uptake protein [Clostridia bacterium]|nr:TrkH family potassium uptake protein [Clostridia bacterium]